MKRYRVSGSITSVVSTIVRAKSPEEARTKAEKRGVQGLCNQCDGADAGAPYLEFVLRDGLGDEVEIGEDSVEEIEE